MPSSERIRSSGSLASSALTALLRPLEMLYRRVVINKRQRFLDGEGEIYQSPVPLIVVGNITVLSLIHI